MRIIKRVSSEYTINGFTYPVEIVYKTEKRNISYRFRDNIFYISSPRNISEAKLIKQLDVYAPKLMKNTSKSEPPETENYVYVLGAKFDKSKGEITFSNREPITFKDDVELKKKLKALLLEITKSLSAYYETELNTNTHYRVHIRDMKTRYGSNSRKTNFYTYNYCLIHYDIEIIKSVVVHEVAHCLQFDHSPRFYKIIKSVLPDYDKLHTKLRKGEFR